MHRAVFYIQGFDPRGPSPYHAMTTEGFASYCAKQDVSFSLSDLNRGNGFVHDWRMTRDKNQNQVDVNFVFLDWNDLIHHYWNRTNNEALVVLAGAFSYLKMFKLGIPQKLYAKSWPMGMTLAAPLIKCVIYSLLFILLGWVAFDLYIHKPCWLVCDIRSICCFIF